MIEWIFKIFWGVWLLFVFIAACRVFGFLGARKRQLKRWGDGSKDQKPVALIVAVKGLDAKSSPRFFDSIFTQNYSNYRVIVSFENWTDPIARWLCEQMDLSEDNSVWTNPQSGEGLQSVTLVAAGETVNQGQKVHNQIAGFRELVPADEVIAFADADIICGHSWLASLTAPINQGDYPLASTYRWLVPKTSTLANQFASVINASITTQGGSDLTNVLWGGSMAISREAFNSIDVPSLFAGSLNDDLRLAKAARKQKHKIAFVRNLVLPTMIDFTWPKFLEFARRQYTQVRIFSPILYRGWNFLLFFYISGLTLAILGIVYEVFWAWIPIAGAYVIDQIRAIGRQRVYATLFESEGIRRKLGGTAWLEHMLTPVWMLLHWLILISTWYKDRITWAGIKYLIVSPSKTRVLSRSDEAEVMPSGIPNLEIYRRTDLGSTGPIQPTKSITPHHTEPSRVPTTEPISPTSATQEKSEADQPTSEELSTQEESPREDSPAPEPTVANEPDEASQQADELSEEVGESSEEEAVTAEKEEIAETSGTPEVDSYEALAAKYWSGDYKPSPKSSPAETSIPLSSTPSPPRDITEAIPLPPSEPSEQVEQPAATDQSDGQDDTEPPAEDTPVSEKSEADLSAVDEDSETDLSAEASAKEETEDQEPERDTEENTEKEEVDPEIAVGALLNGTTMKISSAARETLARARDLLTTDAIPTPSEIPEVIQESTPETPETLPIAPSLPRKQTRRRIARPRAKKTPVHLRQKIHPSLAKSKSKRRVRPRP